MILYFATKRVKTVKKNSAQKRLHTELQPTRSLMSYTSDKLMRTVSVGSSTLSEKLNEPYKIMSRN